MFNKTDRAWYELNKRLQEIDERLRFIEKEIESLKSKQEVRE